MRINIQRACNKLKIPDLFWGNTPSLQIAPLFQGLGRKSVKLLEINECLFYQWEVSQDFVKCHDSWNRVSLTRCCCCCWRFLGLFISFFHSNKRCHDHIPHCLCQENGLLMLFVFVLNQSECFNTQTVAEKLLLQTILSSGSDPPSIPISPPMNLGDSFTPLACSKSSMFPTRHPAVQRMLSSNHHVSVVGDQSWRSVHVKAMAFFPEHGWFQLHFCLRAQHPCCLGV